MEVCSLSDGVSTTAGGRCGWLKLQLMRKPFCPYNAVTALNRRHNAQAVSKCKKQPPVSAVALCVLYLVWLTGWPQEHGPKAFIHLHMKLMRLTVLAGNTQHKQQETLSVSS